MLKSSWPTSNEVAIYVRALRLMSYKTKSQPLDIDDDSVELRYHPLSAFDAVDEFLGTGQKLNESGALELLMTNGTGIRLSPGSWDVADVALIFKALLTAFGVGDDRKPRDIVLEICKKYGVQIKHEDTWEDLGQSAGVEALGADGLVFVVFACLRGSFAPFLTRLKSSVEAMAVAQVKPSLESVEES